MTRTLTRAGIAVALLFAPLVALAAYNDVALTTDANISLTVSGQTVNLDVSGSTANVESITVNAGTFTVVLNDPSTITVSSADRYNLSVDDSTVLVSTTCSATESALTLGSTHSGASITA